MVIDINPEKARANLRIQQSSDKVQRGSSYIDTGRGQLLDTAGADDLSSRGRLKQLYKLRRDKLKQLSNEMRELLIKPEYTKEVSAKINSLAREIKAVVVTDPREVFKLNKRGKWKYLKEANWKAGKIGDANIHAHHIRGLDKYFKAFLKASDEELARFHFDAGKKGFHFGNHPLNRIDIHKAHHLGQGRRLMTWSESIHGLIDWKDISAEDFYDIMTEAISKTDTDITDIMHDPRIGSPGSRKVSEGFTRKPLPVFDEFTNLTDPRIQEQIFEMATDDTRALSNILKQPINPKFWEGNIGANVKRFALEHREELLSDPAKYKPITDALASGEKIPKATLDEWGELFGKSASRYQSWKEPALYSGLPLGTVQDHIETAKDIIGRTPKGRLVRGAALVGGVTLRGLPVLGAGIDAYVAGEAWNKVRQDPSIKNIGAAFGETAILADQVTPFGAVGQMANQVIRQYTDPERGPGKIRGRSGAKRAMEAKKLEQKQLQARFIPSKEQEDWWSQSFTSKSWLTR